VTDSSTTSVAILVEGSGDQRFIECLLCSLYSSEDDRRKPVRENSPKRSIVRFEGKDDRMIEIEVVPMEGYSVGTISNWATKPSDEGKAVVVLVDANFAVEARRQEIMDVSKLLSENVFLMPNNHDKGELEDLLLEIIPERNRRFLRCLHEYKHCLKKAGAKGESDKKGCLYAYREAVGAEPKDSRVDYNNSEHWDLDHDALEPLRNFLTNRIS